MKTGIKSYNYPIKNLTSKQVKEILDEHKKWIKNKYEKKLKDQENKSHQADFSYCHISNFDFSGYDLENIKFHHSVLNNCDFSNAKNIYTDQFAGANVRNTILSNAILDNIKSSLSYIDESIKNLRNIFLLLLSVFSYIAVTINGISDLHLVISTTNVTLPLINSSVKISAFYIISPIILILITLYFHIHTKILFEKIARIPSIMPNSEMLPNICYPWLLNSFIWFNVPRLEYQYRNSKKYGSSSYNLPKLMIFQNILSTICSLYLLPILIGYMFLRYPYVGVDNSRIILAMINIGFLSIAIFMSLYFHLLYKTILHSANKLYIEKIDIFIIASVIVISFGIFAISNIFVEHKFNLYGTEFNKEDCKEKAERFKKAEENVDLWIKSEYNQDGENLFKNKITYDMVRFFKNKSLKGKKITNSNFGSTCLLNTDLENSNFAYSNFTDSYMVASTPYYANFRSAIMNLANLQYSALSGADFTNADLRCADLSNIRNAAYTNFTNAKFGVEPWCIYKTNLSNTDLSSSLCLTKEQLGLDTETRLHKDFYGKETGMYENDKIIFNQYTAFPEFDINGKSACFTELK